MRRSRFMMLRWVGAVCSLLGLGLLAHAAEFEFQVDAGQSARIDIPIRVVLPASLQRVKSVQLVEADTGKELPVQIDGDQFVFLSTSDAGKSGRYRLSSGTAALAEAAEEAASHEVRCEEREGDFVFLVGDRQVLTYHATTSQPPEGTPDYYRRSGHIHPVLTPQGHVVTDEFPVDHPHQHGVFFAWVNTQFDGRKVDFWNQQQRTGTVEHRRVIETVSGPVFARLKAELVHVALSAPDGPVDVLNEEWTITVYGTREGNLFEIDSIQHCATDRPLKLHEYHYGGFGVRGSGEWSGQPEHDFLTSRGDGRATGNHTRPEWTAIYGQVDGEPASLTVFSHPDNVRSPQPVRLHPSMPYFVYSPVVLGEMLIEPGTSLHSRYRIFVADGNPDPNQLERIWENYVSDGPSTKSPN